MGPLPPWAALEAVAELLQAPAWDTKRGRGGGAAAEFKWARPALVSPRNPLRLLVVITIL